MNIEKTFFIEGLELSNINNSRYIPTALCYKNNGLLYGHDAIRQAKEKSIVNNNFKVELGEITSSQLKSERKTFEAEDGSEKTAFELTKDFFTSILRAVEGQENIESFKKKGLKIMVAEPLSFQVEDKNTSWIKNYRENIKRILHNYESVEFLPEPFAVYQYYRYGYRIPQLQGNHKNVAFIIDFGGGTLDISIIESTASGNISIKGKHSKPLAASSEPIGGFFINQTLGEYLIKRGLEKSGDKKKADQLIRTFSQVRKGHVDLDSLNDEKQSFIRNLKKLTNKLETAKIELCNKISNWDLETDDCYEKVMVEIPRNPFSSETPWDISSLYGHELRTLFIELIWKKRIRSTVKSAISRAKESLKGKEITVTLISGGSSNIRWLEKLLTSDFNEDIGHAKPVPLKGSFQEIVAKGLAIECARRFYDPNSEFISVTYNPLRLLMNPDGKGLEENRFSSVENKIDMRGSGSGDLLSSAQALNNFINEPIQWKVRLNHAPKNFLDYYFMRPSDEPLEKQPEDLQNLYNVDKRIHTSRDTAFDSKIRIELVVKEDGTAFPKFIYKVGNEEHNIKEFSECGKPFALDMTPASGNVGSSRYIGFDFGTSNSSVCFTTNSDICTLDTRGKDSSWVELKNLISQLPFPISISLRKYLSVHDIDKSTDNARDAFEAMLAFGAYLATCELTACEKSSGNMRGFAHRSMGPLKGLLEKCLSQLGTRAIFCKPFSKLFKDHLPELNNAISQFNDHKHNKLPSDQVNSHFHLMLLANICKEVMQNCKFGFFEDMKPVKFKKDHYKGIFRIAHDNQPFVDCLSYKDKISFDISDAILINLTSKIGISLSPFYFWDEDQEHGNNYKCYVFDQKTDSGYYYKSASEDESLLLDDDYEGIVEEISAIHKGNCKDKEIFDVNITK